MSIQIKVNFHLHFKYLHNVWPIAIPVWILFCMPFSRQHTVLHFGRLFLVEKSRVTTVEPRLMEMLLMGIGKSLFQIYKKLFFFVSFFTFQKFPTQSPDFHELFSQLGMVLFLSSKQRIKIWLVKRLKIREMWWGAQKFFG